MKFYIADTHMGHKNILHMSHRTENYGFKTIQEMDEKIIENWNNEVSDNDEIYIVGDLIYKSGDPASYLKRLNGQKHLIKGNHDGFIKNKALWKFFESIQDIKFVEDGGRQVVLFHYPMAEWPGYYRNAILLFGHIHNNENEACKIMNGLKNCYNVGADMPYMGMTPRTLEYIQKNAVK